ncbi:hypothetical protein LG632_24820, partial [Streptomyces sp. SMC 277]|nr:hypothetical protein [Streptomyces antimicrobicus]
MNQQGAAPDDWWRKLYDDPSADPTTSGAAPGDTLDSRYASALRVTGPPPPDSPPPPPPAVVPPPRPAGSPA